MNTTVATMQPFTCHECDRHIGYRIGDVLLYAGLEILFKRSQDLTCPHCKQPTRFFVSRTDEKNVKVN